MEETMSNSHKLFDYRGVGIAIIGVIVIIIMMATIWGRFFKYENVKWNCLECGGRWVHTYYDIFGTRLFDAEFLVDGNVKCDHKKTFFKSHSL
jgi:hypothetical protein